MRSIQYIVVALIMAMCFVSCTDELDKAKQEAMPSLNNLSSEAKYNVERAYDIVDKVFPFVALIESDHGEGKPYYDRAARWTVWYGTTVKPDGSMVRRNDPWIPRSKGKEYCYIHLFKHVFPFFQHFDKRKLTDEQIICTALFIYNVGGENVTGFNIQGKRVGTPSSYLLAVNQGKNAEYCVNCLTGFRKANGKLAGGLLKRHWVEGAAYLGILTPQNILPLKPAQFYETKNYGNYFWLNKRRRMIQSNGFYKLRYDDITIEAFFRMNTAGRGQKSVGSII